MTSLSMIVPVYNTGKYIEKCLNSILTQTRKEKVEVIVINDGSTDNSRKIIQDYIEKHPQQNIKYFEKENEGIAKTRNFGIQKATSPYILFVDSDDYIDSHLTEKLEPYMESQIDLIKFKLQRVDKKGKVLEKVEGPIFQKITGEEAFCKMYSKDLLLDSPCVYAIKKELFTKNNLSFQRTYHEDFGLIPILLLIAKSVVSIQDYLYNYVQVENSITRNSNYQKTLQKMDDCLAHYDNMVETIENFKLSKKAKEDVRIYYTNAILLKLEELQKKDQSRYIKQIKVRKFSQNIKARNAKQLLKKLLLQINIKLYLKMR